MKLFTMLLCAVLVGCAMNLSPVEDKMSVEALNEDFQFLRKQLHEIHPNLFLHQSQEDEHRLFEELSNELTQPVDTTSFYKIVARYTTSFRDGHTFPSMAYATRQFRTSLRDGNTVLPIALDFNEGYFYIKDTHTASANEIKGSRLVAINNIPAEHIIEAFQNYYAKNAFLFDNAHVRLFKEYFWLSYGSFSKWEITYQRDEALSETITMDGMTRSEFSDQQMRSQQGIPADPEFAFEYLDGGRVGLLTLNRMGNLSAFQQFLATKFKELQEQNVHFLIIDMRKNGGGSSTLGDALYAYLSNQPYHDGKMYVKISKPIKNWYIQDRPNHILYDFVVQHDEGQLVLYPDTSKTIPQKVDHLFSGTSYLLTSAKTYSSGHMFAGLFKCNNIGPIVGQETGQATKTVGDAFTFQLPNSGIDISVSYKVFEGSCDPSYSNGFIPDYEVKYSAEDLASGDDKEVMFVMNLIKNTSQ